MPLRTWMLIQSTLFVSLCALEGAGFPESAGAATVGLASPDQAVVLVILDNSASVPPLDPEGKRREALEQVLTFLEGQPHRLLLFGGREEIDVDAPDRYTGTAEWTDFYFVFAKAQEIAESYPEGTDFKMILITDGIVDPSPQDWTDMDVPAGSNVKSVSAQRTLEILGEMGLPLYVMQVGDISASVFVRQMVSAANGPILANRYAQGLSEFFEDDGVLLRRFIYHVDPLRGLAHIEPFIRRILRPPAYRVEFSIVMALLLFISVLVGIGVRSFPGPGDQEVIELTVGSPLHIAVDRLRRLPSNVPSWSRRGLSVASTSDGAAATMTLHEGSQDFSPDGLDLSHLDGVPKQLIHLSLPALRQRLEELLKSSEKGDMIAALNLDYVAPDFDPVRAEKMLTASLPERRKMNAMEFLRAKIHLLHNDALRSRLTGPRVHCLVFGRNGDRSEICTGDTVELGRYAFRVTDLARGGRRDYRMTLAYEVVPSALLLKRMVPALVQRVLRFRRSHERVVA